MVNKERCPDPKCQHEWYPRFDREPVQCPKCRKRLRWPPKKEAPINSTPEDSGYTEAVEV